MALKADRITYSRSIPVKNVQLYRIKIIRKNPKQTNAVRVATFKSIHLKIVLMECEEHKACLLI